MELNEGWKRTCIALLGEEIGGITTYENYLKKFVDPLFPKKSFMSGKEVFV